MSFEERKMGFEPLLLCCACLERWRYGFCETQAYIVLWHAGKHSWVERLSRYYCLYILEDIDFTNLQSALLISNVLAYMVIISFCKC